MWFYFYNYASTQLVRLINKMKNKGDVKKKDSFCLWVNGMNKDVC